MFKENQQVLMIRGSKKVRGVVTSIDISMYPVHVEFEDGEHGDFTPDGKFYLFEDAPCLFPVDAIEDRAKDLLQEALLQLECLNNGTSNDLISRIKTFLNEA